VRKVNWLLLSAGLGLGGALASIPMGCAIDCGIPLEDDYVECTSRPGLRYTQCGPSYEFNDGTHFRSLGSALDHCYCGEGRITCEDGRTASLCNTSPLDGLTALYFDDDGSSDELAGGLEKCLEVPNCALVTSYCSFNGWFAQCGSRYVTSTGEIVESLSAAITACNPGPSEDTSATVGSCVKKVEECSDLANCTSSQACINDFGGCNTFPACYDHDELVSCAQDVACMWETY
jgi:hypothetical protein